MKFELTFANMEQRPVMNAKSWQELMRQGNLDTTDLLKIEFVEPAQRKRDIAAVNSAFHSAGRMYWDAGAIRNYVADALRVNGFELPYAWDNFFTGNEGERRCIAIGRGVHLHVTWYRMTSGKYEVVAYIN